MIKKHSPNQRCFHSYHQHTEEFTVNGKTVKRWMFNVPWFCLDNKHVRVMKSDGTNERVPIDDEGRILILGKWYGRAYWNH